jgi:dienelactone hydrolase
MHAHGIPRRPIGWMLLLSMLCGMVLEPTLAEGPQVTLYEAARRQSRQISSRSLAQPLSPAEWERSLELRRKQWLRMLGLEPMPERGPLEATVTGTLERGDYVVEKIHFQSLPGAYVVGNLYRPAEVTQPLPAVLYLCGHTLGKVSATYQSHPRWFAQHGYVALVLDPIQLGESQGIHHGTHRFDRWDWPSRGYSPIATEVWNGMRALDYLETRDDVDPERIGVTGLSGGGVVSWCLGAADERVKVVVPVCQSGSIEHAVVDRATDGHCDCAFWINYYRWCWPDVGALIAPRALLIASGSEDALWRPFAYRDVAHRIRHQYAALGIADQFELVEDLSPHGYTPKLRRAIFQWFNTHLRGDASPVVDDVTDHVEPVENLLVFGGTLPEEDAMRHIEKLLVPRAEPPELPGDEATWVAHQRSTLQRLRELTFRNLPLDFVPSPDEVRADGGQREVRLESYHLTSSDGVSVRVQTARSRTPDGAEPLLVFAVQPDARSSFGGGGSSRPGIRPNWAKGAVEVRNTGSTSVGPGYLWTARRMYPLLGQTLPERQVHDLLGAVAMLRQQPEIGPIALYGKGYTAPLAIYAALLDPEVSELILDGPPTSHEDPETPEFLGVLQIGDLPQNLALFYPRPITFVGKIPPAYQWTRQVYEQLGAGDLIRVVQ